MPLQTGPICVPKLISFEYPSDVGCHGFLLTPALFRGSSAGGGEDRALGDCWIKS
jgi:hypothetical protein